MGLRAPPCFGGPGISLAALGWGSWDNWDQSPPGRPSPASEASASACPSPTTASYATSRPVSAGHGTGVADSRGSGAAGFPSGRAPPPTALLGTASGGRWCGPDRRRCAAVIQSLYNAASSLAYCHAVC